MQHSQKKTPKQTLPIPSQLQLPKVSMVQAPRPVSFAQGVRLHVWLLWLNVMFVKFIHIVGCICRSFIFSTVGRSSSNECANIYLSVLLLMGIWVVSNLLPGAFLFMGFGADMYTLLLDTRSRITTKPWCGHVFCFENSAVVLQSGLPSTPF